MPTQDTRWSYDPVIAGFVLIALTASATFIIATIIESITLMAVMTLVVATAIFLGWAFMAS